jgi:hypothetical protein
MAGAVYLMAPVYQSLTMLEQEAQYDRGPMLRAEQENGVLPDDGVSLRRSNGQLVIREE